jgi:hypothetical protein
MRFLRTVRAAIYSDDYVVHFKDRSLFEMAWFVFRLCVIQGALVMLIAIPSLYSGIHSLVSGSFVRDNYPQDLEVTITNGQVSTNKSGAYFIPEPGVGSTTPKNFMVIDTSTANPIAAFKQYDTFSLLTKDSIVAQRPGHIDLSVIPLTNVKNLYVSRDSVQGYINNHKSWIYILALLGVVLIPLAVGFFTTLYYLAILLLYTLAAWLIAKIRKIPLKYSQAYILSGYLLTFPILLDILMDVSRLGNPAIRGYVKFVFFLVFVAIAILNIRREPVSTGEEIAVAS